MTIERKMDLGTVSERHIMVMMVWGGGVVFKIPKKEKEEPTDDWNFIKNTNQYQSFF